MIARLILALLLAAFAVPAAAPAACHDASTPAPHTMMMAADTADASDTMPDRKAVPLHGCIGCIPPSNWTSARIAAVAPTDAPVLVERAPVLDIGMVTAPVPPPPRKA
ncbi:hypothetical protein VH567_16845 [Sphingomonas sp. 4RDLI-65]|uniref:hypothetical protein n=1 Tax=Sphingomonas sp. 4RDLI-65 TaxID=3111641 RepID=UPI003C18ED19